MLMGNEQGAGELIDGGMMIEQDMHFFCQFGMIQFQSPMMVCKGNAS